MDSNPDSDAAGKGTSWISCTWSWPETWTLFGITTPQVMA
jgi:hypothetical protein